MTKFPTAQFTWEAVFLARISRKANSRLATQRSKEAVSRSLGHTPTWNNPSALSRSSLTLGAWPVRDSRRDNTPWERMGEPGVSRVRKP